MGLGPYYNGRPHPITPFKGSWAEEQQKQKESIRENQIRGCDEVCKEARSQS